jgi:hypothetical protein
MVLSVISRLTCAIAKLNTIVKIHNYRRFHEGHHFISIAMEVYNIFERDMDCFIKECACLFHDRRSKGHLSLYFCIQFSRQRINISFQHVLASIIEGKIVLVGDACSRPLITIKYHNLHAYKIRGAVGEITSHHERD